MMPRKWFGVLGLLAVLLPRAAPGAALWLIWELDLGTHAPPTHFELVVSSPSKAPVPPLTTVPWQRCTAIGEAAYCAQVGCPPEGTYDFTVRAVYAAGTSASATWRCTVVSSKTCGCAELPTPAPPPPVALVPPPPPRATGSTGTPTLDTALPPAPTGAPEGGDDVPARLQALEEAYQAEMVRLQADLDAAIRLAEAGDPQQYRAALTPLLDRLQQRQQALLETFQDQWRALVLQPMTPRQ